MKKKILLGSIFGIILFIFIINFNKIKFLFSFIDLHKEKPIVENSSENEISLESGNPLKTLIEDDSNDEFNDSPEASDDKPEENANANKKDKTKIKKAPKTTSNKPKNSAVDKNQEEKPEEESKSLNSIANKYNGRFESLQTEFMNSLDDLVQSGYSDYKNGNISKSKLINKYLDLGSSLEKKSDEKFFSLLDKMKIELKENGHSTDITKEIASYYKSFKGSEKKKLLNKAKGHM